jgi:adenine deaminase
MSILIKGNLVDIQGEEIYPAEIRIEKGRIDSILRIQEGGLPYLMPGFIDAHVHIESSMLIPFEFSRLALPHGTVATVSDPHEIANVCGLEGVDFMIENGGKSPLKFYFGAPSCVPATIFETAGAKLGVDQVGRLLEKKEIRYLSEMMNFPGVLHKDEEVMQKIGLALRMGKRVDGHAPGLRGQDAKAYADAGITTDHECVSMEEALDKLKFGMKIIIREGSAAKNFEALVGLVEDYSDRIMFGSDDKHPDSLLEGHIDQLCRRAVAKGINVFKVLRAACFNPVIHYGLDVGLLKEGDPADFILVRDLVQFEVLETYIEGNVVARKGKSMVADPDRLRQPALNKFNCQKKTVGELAYPVTLSGSTTSLMNPLRIIEVLDGQLMTNSINGHPKTENGKFMSDVRADILKIVVVNRYVDAPPSKAFIKNFGLKKGAIASSVAHDCHNIVAVGVDDESLCESINLIIENQGGISCVNGSEKMILPLPVAGLMSFENAYLVASSYISIDAMAKGLGSTLTSPFMSLSFMALLVIPHLKLSDMGLFDGDEFRLI